VRARGCPALAPALILLASCGYVGEPLPPTLDIPAPVTDLRAAEIGEQIRIEFTLPALTTEGVPLKEVRAVEVFIGPNVVPFSYDAWAGGAKPYPVSTTAPGQLARDAPAKDWLGLDIVVAVRATGPKGKLSGWSNPASLRIGQPLAPPNALRADNVARGVALSWQSPGPRFRIFRAVGEGAPTLLAEAGEPLFVDETTTYGERYRYRVHALASATHLSEFSAEVAITPQDVFPPAVPAGVTLAAAPQSIELAWERNTEADFRGYNVYRSIAGGPFEKVSSLLDAPAWSDTAIESGKRYRYAISAEDAEGNESARSEPVEIAAP
jgi:hypothetical protein